ncbi:MAG: SDR family NAD(P)-dependent oxidoreductase [Alphaproteobacteria bacterium]|nr:SDR family NAD(P)-dependent oxidoreductase [Alphaproteobacteria bacterium]
MSGRIVLITGGTYGIGRAASLGFAAQGDKVYTFGVGEAATKGVMALAREAGHEVSAATLDITDTAAVRTLISDILAREGRIDVLVNNAAVRPTGTIETASDEEWDIAFDVNVRGMFVAVKAVLPQMLARKQGVIVNVASGSGYGRGGLLAYGASKGAVFAFTKCLAIDHAAQGIRVNTVVPGFTETGMTEDFPEKVMAMGAGMSVAGRVNKPEEIANAILWLASDQASVVSGITLEAGTLPR